MALVYIQEFSGLAPTPSGDAMLPVVQQPPVASYTVSNALGPNAGPIYQPTTKWLQVETDGICSVRFDGVAAAATDQRLPATALAPLLVSVAGVQKGNISVIANT